jgi:hypothetical protein
VGATKLDGGVVTIYTEMGDITLAGTAMTPDADFLKSLGVDAAPTDGGRRRLVTVGGRATVDTYNYDCEAALVAQAPRSAPCLAPQAPACLLSALLSVP